MDEKEAIAEVVRKLRLTAEQLRDPKIQALLREYGRDVFKILNAPAPIEAPKNPAITQGIRWSGKK